MPIPPCLGGSSYSACAGAVLFSRYQARSWSIPKHPILVGWKRPAKFHLQYCGNIRSRLGNFLVDTQPQCLPIIRVRPHTVWLLRCPSDGFFVSSSDEPRLPSCPSSKCKKPRVVHPLADRPNQKVHQCQLPSSQMLPWWTGLNHEPYSECDFGGLPRGQAD
jgi:hypothetical protein